MNKLHMLSVAVAAVLVSGFAIAQTTAPKATQKIDANGDGVITKAEAAAFPRLAEKFDQLDTNKDGKLSAAEQPRLHAGKRGHDRRHDRLQAHDTDKDGRISRAEMEAARGKFAERFDQADVNKDGYLDAKDKEARAANYRAEFFAGADANKDGKLSRDEFTVEQAARAAERREKFAEQAKDKGRQAPARTAPTDAERLQRAGAAFDRIDANKDGVVTKAEFDAHKLPGGGDRGKGPRPPKG